MTATSILSYNCVLTTPRSPPWPDRARRPSVLKNVEKATESFTEDVSQSHVASEWRVQRRSPKTYRGRCERKFLKRGIVSSRFCMWQYRSLLPKLRTRHSLLMNWGRFPCGSPQTPKRAGRFHSMLMKDASRGNVQRIFQLDVLTCARGATNMARRRVRSILSLYISRSPTSSNHVQANFIRTPPRQQRQMSRSFFITLQPAGWLTFAGSVSNVILT